MQNAIGGGVAKALSALSSGDTLRNAVGQGISQTGSNFNQGKEAGATGLGDAIQSLGQGLSGGQNFGNVLKGAAQAGYQGAGGFGGIQGIGSQAAENYSRGAGLLEAAKRAIAEKAAQQAPTVSF
jgi:hypothetical protein